MQVQPGAPPRGTPRAFTLIELMIVVAIVGIGATLGLASLSPIAADVRLHGAARGTAALIRGARVHALTHHARVRVMVSGTTISLEACPAKFGSPNACARNTNFVTLPNQSVVLSSADARSVTLSSSPFNAVVFGASGLPEGAAALAEYVFSNSNRTRKVQVTPGGEVRVP